MQSTESRSHWTGKYTVCRRVRASFSPEIVQAGTVRGLTPLGLLFSRFCYSHDSAILTMLKSWNCQRKAHRRLAGSTRTFD